MITGDWRGGDGASVEGITIVDSPGYNFFGGATSAYTVKILSPWFFSTDGFQGVSHVPVIVVVGLDVDEDRDIRTRSIRTFESRGT